ncbi:MAG: ribosome biogenesis GTP-binding protein YihA/YsxC [Psychroflexus sp.]|jgi:GTP-binding protein|nr:ribosome biogenesis GTP-binding protein YihA/YsxC [Psychroflexus sp.]MDR9448161.1 ribosome biogenesis GTP-binding protein YihA/YsxC [Psychroflexus sp.]
MMIKEAIFVESNSDALQCPDRKIPEYAFIGRSNVGKSSLINMLCRKKKLAKTSGKPGKTQLINHFLINDEWFLVDLPGYGYAKTSKTQRKKLGQIINQYLSKRQQLVLLFVLIDIRHEPQTLDLDFIYELGVNGVPFAIVFTKTDKLKPAKVENHLNSYLSKLSETWEELPPYFLSSAVSGDGRQEILDFIANTNQNL